MTATGTALIERMQERQRELDREEDQFYRECYLTQPGSHEHMMAYAEWRRAAGRATGFAEAMEMIEKGGG